MSFSYEFTFGVCMIKIRYKSGESSFLLSFLTNNKDTLPPRVSKDTHKLKSHSMLNFKG